MTNFKQIAKQLEMKQNAEASQYDDFGYILKDDDSEWLILKENERFPVTLAMLREGDSALNWNTDFLLSYLGKKTRDVIEMMKREGQGKELLEFIENRGSYESLVEEATRIDGYGLFLSPYDHTEVELENGSYAYRLN